MRSVAVDDITQYNGRTLQTELEHDPYYGPTFLSETTIACFAKDAVVAAIECSASADTTDRCGCTMTPNGDDQQNSSNNSINVIVDNSRNNFKMDKMSWNSQFTVPSTVLSGMQNLCIKHCFPVS